jgi:hypothetical protein
MSKHKEPAASQSDQPIEPEQMAKGEDYVAGSEFFAPTAEETTSLPPSAQPVPIVPADQTHYSVDEVAALDKYSSTYEGVNPDQCCSIAIGQEALDLFQQEYFRQFSISMPQTYLVAIPTLDGPQVSYGIPVTEMLGNAFPADWPIFLHYYWIFSYETVARVNVALSVDLAQKGNLEGAVKIMYEEISAAQESASHKKVAEEAASQEQT